MSSFLAAAIGMLLGVIPLGTLAWRGTVLEAVVAYEVISSLAVMVLVLLAQGFGRSAEWEMPLVLAVLLLGAGLVFVRTLERWL